MNSNDLRVSRSVYVNAKDYEDFKTFLKRVKNVSTSEVLDALLALCAESVRESGFDATRDYTFFEKAEIWEKFLQNLKKRVFSY